MGKEKRVNARRRRKGNSVGEGAIGETEEPLVGFPLHNQAWTSGWHSTTPPDFSQGETARDMGEGKVEDRGR